jgi:mRNA-degrading endonuclease toxin of MazEF toxin-antitoxin module
VVCDVDVLDHRAARVLIEGLGEVVKYGLIQDPVVLELLEAAPAEAVAGEPGLLEELVRRSVAVKAAVVAADEREGGIRAFLNFGHTYAHAVETLSGYGTVLHGEAVSIGMVVALRLGQRLGHHPTGPGRACRDTCWRRSGCRSVVRSWTAVRCGRSWPATRRPGVTGCGSSCWTGSPRPPRSHDRGVRRPRPMPLSYWYATVPFDDGEGSKERPVLVLRQDGSNARVLKVTSQFKEGRANYRRVDTAGWDRPGARNGSWVQTDRVVTIPLRNFRRRLGDERDGTLKEELAQLHRHEFL